jgi:hypothetical protein
VYITTSTIGQHFGKLSIRTVKMAATAKNTEEIEKAKKLDHVPWCDEYEKMISGML